MIKHSHRRNVLAMVRREHQPFLDIVAAYEKGGDIEELTAGWDGYGTTGAAIAEYIKANHKKKPAPRKRKAAKKDE